MTLLSKDVNRMGRDIVDLMDAKVSREVSNRAVPQNDQLTFSFFVF